MENENKIQNKVVETYAEDMARVIESDQGGLIKKIIQEQEQKEFEKKYRSPASRTSKIYMLLGSVVILMAFGVLMFLGLQEDTNTVPIERQLTPLIFNDKTFFIETESFSKDQVIASILTEFNTTNLKNDGLEAIYLTQNKNMVGLRNFLTLLKSDFIPPNENVLSDQFLMGLTNTGTKNFFFILRSRSFQDGFENIKPWENKMFYDLHRFFGYSLSSFTSYLFTKSFDNGIIENKNARILYDSEGNIVMMYVFVDDNHVVITSKIEPVRELMSRLSSSRLEK